MTNREKVIKGLEKCRRCECDDCTEKGASKAPWDCPAYDNFVDSALALLKEQEAVTVHDPGAFCPKCGWMLYPEDHPKFCGNCGYPVKWE